jgi:hypothetical protein
MSAPAITIQAGPVADRGPRHVVGGVEDAEHSRGA